MGKMLVSNWLDMLDVDDFTQSTRVNDILDGSIIWRVAKNWSPCQHVSMLEQNSEKKH